MLLGRGAGVCALLATCARSPCASKLSETRGVPSSGAGPSQNETCLGGGIGSKIRAGRTTACCNLFSVRQDPNLYNANYSAPSENNRLFGERTAASNRASSRIMHLLYLRPSFLPCLRVITHIRGHIAGSSPPSPLYLLWVELRQQLFPSERHANNSHNRFSTCSYLRVDISRLLVAL